MKVQAYAAAGATSPMAPFAIERHEPLAHDVAIEILYCGMCHTDLHHVAGLVRKLRGRVQIDTAYSRSGQSAPA